MLTICLFTACSEISFTGLMGEWDLVSVKNGPLGYCQDDFVRSYPTGTVIVDFKGNGTIVFIYDTGKTETFDYSVPDNQEQFGSSLPVIEIGEVPFSYDIEGNMLYLQYLGPYSCDHIPATFVFRRAK